MAAATASAWSMACGTLSRRRRAPFQGKLVASPAAKIAGSEVRPCGVGGDAVVDGEAGGGGQARLGVDADADEDEVGGEGLAGGEQRRR